MTTKPDLSNVKRRDYKELASKREGLVKPRKDRSEYPKRTVVTSCSVPPELKVRIKRDIGDGSFSRGVVKAAIAYLIQLDQERAEEKRYRG